MASPAAWPKIDIKSLPNSISEFFSAEEFANMSPYEKMHLGNLRQNYEMLKRSGLPVKPPQFMQRGKHGGKKRKAVAPLPTDDSEDSDKEWTPASERVPKKSSFRGFVPPKVKDKSESSGTSKPRQKRNKTTAKEIEQEPIHEYPFRKKRKTCMMSLNIPDDDDFLFCEECNMEFEGDCPEHGPLNVIEDSPVPETCIKGKDPEYCLKSVPKGLTIKKSKIPKAGQGVFATQFFPTRTRFGPYGGSKEKNEEVAFESGYCWQVMCDERISHFVDASDPKESNWMRFVNCARSEDEQCLTAYQYKGEIYYRAHKDIKPGSELLVRDRWRILIFIVKK